MKKLWLSFLSGLIFLNFSYAQNTFPTPSGAVGIGTTSPASGLMLDVIGNGSFSGALSLGLGGGGTNVFQQTLAHNYNGIPYVSYPGQFRWYASPNNSLYKDNALFQLRSWDAGTNTENTMATFTGGGNFGIGTTNPKDYLHVFSGTANSLTTAARLSGGDGGPDAGTSMLFTSAYSDGSWLTGRIGALSSGYGTDYGSSLVFHTNSGASTATLTEKMRIDKNGNVGIGTTSPSTMLHVTGPGTAYGNILTTVTPSLYSNGNASGLGYGLLSNSTFANQGAWSNIGLVQQTSNANDIAAGVHLAIYGWYQNSGTSVPISLGGGYAGINPSVYIASGDAYGNGNVGVGTTAPVDVFTIKTGIISTGTYGGDFLRLKSWTGTPGGTTSNIFGGGAIRSTITDGVGGLTFNADASINVSATNNGNEIMRVMGNGTVGIGTTSPQKTLHILTGDQGSSRIRIENGNTAAGGRPFDLVAGVNNISQGGFSIYDANVAATRFLIDNNGNVGVGTTSPGAALSVVSSNPVIQLFDTDYNPGNGTGIGKIAFGSSAEWASIEAFRNNGTADDVTYMKFSTSFASGAGGDGINMERMRITHNGNVAIGTTDPKGYKLAVAGNAIAEQMTVKLQADWPDYIFKKDYTLMPLGDLKTYIDKNHHLPEIPSAADVEKDGLNLGEMNKQLVKKVEELTLYLIEKDKELTDQKEILKRMEKRLESLEKNQK